MSTSWSATEHDYDPEFEEAPDKGTPYDVPTERLAVVSLVAGIAGFFLPIVGPVTAVVSGHVARGEIRKSNGRLGGDGLARTGLILGYVWLGLTVLVVLAMFSFTMVLVASDPDGVVVRPGRTPAAMVRGEGPNVMIQRLHDGRVMIEHGETPVDLDQFPKGTIRLHHSELARPGRGVPVPPEIPQLP